MSRKAISKIASIFFIWVLVCTVFLGAVEGQVVKESLGVVVTDSETEIIGSTLTDRYRNRRIRVENGESEIIVTAWGSNNEETWEFWDSMTVDPEKTESMILGTNHFWYVKLTGKTTAPQEISVINAGLYYHEP